MIVLDTHVWIWWVDDHPRLNRAVRDRIDAENDAESRAEGSICPERRPLRFRAGKWPKPGQWLEIAQTAQQIRVERLTGALCVESTTLPGEFHRDPADRLLVALARQLDAELVTADSKILAYPHVRSFRAE
ncbi:MAG: type II toxin-antitoxin system VapC family toxin [Tepidisphaeraceae bacterium]